MLKNPCLQYCTTLVSFLDPTGTLNERKRVWSILGLVHQEPVPASPCRPFPCVCVVGSGWMRPVQYFMPWNALSIARSIFGYLAGFSEIMAMASPSGTCSTFTSECSVFKREQQLPARVFCPARDMYLQSADISTVDLSMGVCERNFVWVYKRLQVLQHPLVSRASAHSQLNTHVPHFKGSMYYRFHLHLYIRSVMRETLHRASCWCVASRTPTGLFYWVLPLILWHSIAVNFDQCTYAVSHTHNVECSYASKIDSSSFHMN